MDNIPKFDTMAHKYDSDERIKIANIISNEIKKYLPNTDDKILMDYGCGTGLIGIEFTKTFEYVLFIDGSNNMIEEVKKKLNHLNISNAFCMPISFCTIPNSDILTTIKVDYIFICQTLIHIEDTYDILNNLSELLKENGHIIIVDFDKNEKITSKDVHNGFNQSDLINIMEKLGFKNLVSNTFYFGEKIFMNEDSSLFIMDFVKM